MFKDGYSLADVAAVTNGGYGNGGGFFGGDGAWWIIILFLFCFAGWGGNGFGGGYAGGAPSIVGNEITYGLDMSNLDRNIDDLSSATAQGFYNIGTSLVSGFGNTNAAIAAGTSAIQHDICDLSLAGVQNTNALMSAINSGTVAGLQNTFTISTQLANMQAAQQLANCQTDQMISGALAQLNYNIATENCADRQAVTDGVRDIIDAGNANTRSILDFLVQDRIAALQSENAALKNQASQAEQNAYLLSQLRPAPNPAYIVANPYASYYQGCGCGCGNMVG